MPVSHRSRYAPTTVYEHLVDTWRWRLQREIAAAQDALAPAREIDLLRHMLSVIDGLRPPALSAPGAGSPSGVSRR